MTSFASYAMERILVPFDGAPLSVDILEYALALSGPARHLTVLLAGMPESTSLESIAFASPVLARYGALHPTMRITASGPGKSPTESIIDTARALRSNLIIMAIQDQEVRNDRAGEVKTVIEEVALTADIPVMAIRPTTIGQAARPIHTTRIIVPLDGSAVSRQALPVAAGLARQLDVAVHLLTVIDPVSALPPAYAYLSGIDFDRHDAIASLQYQANQSLNRAEARLRATGIRVSSDLVYGPTRPCLIAAIEEGDVLVMTTHGEGKSTHSRFGSVALGIVRESPAPVIVLHASPSSRAEEHGRVSWEGTTASGRRHDVYAERQSETTSTIIPD